MIHAGKADEEHVLTVRVVHDEQAGAQEERISIWECARGTRNQCKDWAQRFGGVSMDDRRVVKVHSASVIVGPSREWEEFLAGAS